MYGSSTEISLQLGVLQICSGLEEKHIITNKDKNNNRHNHSHQRTEYKWRKPITNLDHGEKHNHQISKSKRWKSIIDLDLGEKHSHQTSKSKKKEPILGINDLHTGGTQKDGVRVLWVGAFQWIFGGEGSRKSQRDLIAKINRKRRIVIC